MSNPHCPEKERIWIDVAMAVTPYLLFAGLEFNEKRYIDEAANQAFLMSEEFLDAENGLLHQCKNFTGPGRYSEDHWGRGNGWGYIALTELVQYLPEDSEHRPKNAGKAKNQAFFQKKICLVLYPFFRTSYVTILP